MYVIKDNMNKSEVSDAKSVYVGKEKTKKILKLVKNKLSEVGRGVITEGKVREILRLAMSEAENVCVNKEKAKEIKESAMKLLSEKVYKAIIYKTLGDFVDEDMVEKFVRDCPYAHPFKYSSFRDWCRINEISDEWADKKYEEIASKILASFCPIFVCFEELVQVISIIWFLVVILRDACYVSSEYFLR